MEKNRVIKFRAWDAEHKKFNPTVAANILLQLHEPSEVVDPEYGKRFFLQQFTGLKFPNGEECYEGDILERTSSTGKGKVRGEVIYNGDCFIVKWKGRGGWNNWLQIHLRESIKVGNIYEHPSLLNKTESK